MNDFMKLQGSKRLNLNLKAQEKNKNGIDF